MKTTTKRTTSHTKADRDALRWLALIDLPDDQDTTPCWTWTGAAHGQGRGYGKFWLDGKTISAHKAGYLLFRGPVTPGNVLGHTCNNERCANPWHLVDQTQAENMSYCVESGRHPSQR